MRQNTRKLFLKKISISFVAGILFLASFSAFSHAGIISGVLQNELNPLSNNDFIEAVILMKEKVDPARFGSDPTLNVEAVKTFCAASQAPLVAELERLKAAGAVRRYKSYWFFNGIGVNATRRTLEELAKRSDIERIIPNGKYSVPPTTTQPAAPLSGLALQAAQSNISQIKADQVWTLKDSAGNFIKGTNVKVGNLDTGALLTHPDLLARIFKAATFDLSGNKTSDTCTDTNGHGTHTTGIIAGGEASGSNIGVAPEALLLIGKVFDDTSNASNQSVAGGAEWAISEGARIINMSLGGDTGQIDFFWFQQINQWDQLGIFIACSIGNSGPDASTTTSPGNVPNAMASGAVDSIDLIRSFSSRGPVVWNGVTFTKPDIVAPGVSIRSSNNGTGASAYIERTGTSMASPHTAGTAALIKQADSTLTGGTIRQTLKTTADKVNQSTVADYPNSFGNGRLNALTAVNAVLTPDTTPPTITHTSVEAGTFGSDIVLSAVVTDNRSADLTVLIKYTSGGFTTREAVMRPVVAGSTTYRGTIPASDTLEDLRYFIEAKDPAGNTAQAFNTNNQPFSITIQAETALEITNVINAPNPFAPDGTAANGTHITFFLSKAAPIEIRIYDITGALLHTITGTGTLGYNDFQWTGVTGAGQILANGAYIYQIQARDGATTVLGRGKMAVIR